MIATTPHSHTYQLTAQRIEQLGGLDAAINKCAQPHTDQLANLPRQNHPIWDEYWVPIWDEYWV